MKTFCIIYHKEDIDGVLSASIADLFLTKALCRDDESFHSELMGADYNDVHRCAEHALNNDYDYVIMLDISTYLLKDLYEKYKDHLIWIDHHKTAIDISLEKGYDTIGGRRMTDRSAIKCTWEYLGEIWADKMFKSVPDILRCLSAWDSFTFQKEGFDKEDAHAVSVYLTWLTKLSVKDTKDVFFSNPMTIHSNPFLRYCIINGKTMLQEMDEENETLVKNKGEIWNLKNGRRVISLEHYGARSSEMFKSVKDVYQNGIVYRKVDGKYSLSLYNTNEDDDFHCGEYLRDNYNGGGHQGAGGCTLSIEEMEKIFRNKTL